MDQDRFDGIARALAAGTSRRGALLGAFGALAGIAGADAASGRGKPAAKRRKKRCTPPCAAGQSCVRGACRCDNGGTVCGANCCLIGQRCEGGTCVELPDPGSCIAYGEPCKNAGRPCCENLACGSGQGGADVACWVRKTGRCTSTAECVYGTECVDGICIAPVPPPFPTCTPTIRATADREANGNALKAAFVEAATNPGSVIVIDSGEYWLGDADTDDGIVWDADGVTVTLQGCPGGDAVITQTGDNGGMFTVDGGTLRLVGPGLTIRGNTSVCQGPLAKDYGIKVNGATARAELRDLRIVDTGRNAIRLEGGGSLEMSGGLISPIVPPTGTPSYYCNAMRVDVDSASQVSCDSNPTVIGLCAYDAAGVTPGDGNCCPSWVPVTCC